jgi:uncharacterized protein YdaU (DUF1376 family)
MNFYPHHIGDFNNATRHLTRVERSVYREAIELYYDTENALTLDVKKLERRLLCFSDEEKSALQSVLSEFFTETEYGYFNERCYLEIEKYRSNTSNKAKAGKASAEARKIKSDNVKQNSTPVEHVNTLCSTNHNQEPITNNHKPITNNDVGNISELSITVSANKSAPKKNGKALTEDWVLPKAYGEWALLNIEGISENEIRLEADKFKDHWLSNANRAYSKKADWFATWRNWMRNIDKRKSTFKKEMKGHGVVSDDQFKQWAEGGKKAEVIKIG